MVVRNLYCVLDRCSFSDSMTTNKFLSSVVVSETLAMFCFPHIDLHGLPLHVNDYQFNLIPSLISKNHTDSVNFAIFHLQDIIYNFSNEIKSPNPRQTTPSRWTARDFTSYTDSDHKHQLQQAYDAFSLLPKGHHFSNMHVI